MESLTNIELLVLDVDGVLTDGRIILDSDGREMKQFNTQDGAGIKYFQRAGKHIAIITGRESPVVERRAAELGVKIVIQGAKDKLPAYESVLAELDLTDEQTAVMGDDLPDLPMLLRCGFPIAPANAVEEVRRAAALITENPGGEGAVRQAVEYILKHTGQWDSILERYYHESHE